MKNKKYQGSKQRTHTDYAKLKHNDDLNERKKLDSEVRKQKKLENSIEKQQFIDR